MVEVRFRRDSRQRLSSVLAQGHANTAAHGEDVVCAGASAILQSLELGLTAYAALPGTTTRGADGYLHIAIPSDARDREDVKALAATAELAIAQLARQYPSAVRCIREAQGGGT
ncbi:MAG: ribosomal-processing cysteine protease Prp [Candidatus Velthaea sp.]